jgi:hypothetical protein
MLTTDGQLLVQSDCVLNTVSHTILIARVTTPDISFARIPAQVVTYTGQVLWDLWWTKRHCGRISPSTLFPFPNSLSTNCSIIHHLGLVQQASSGPSNSGLGLSPPQETKE